MVLIHEITGSTPVRGTKQKYPDQLRIFLFLLRQWRTKISDLVRQSAHRRIERLAKRSYSRTRYKRVKVPKRKNFRISAQSPMVDLMLELMSCAEICILREFAVLRLKASLSIHQFDQEERL
jgi:hypothetical protein